MERGPDELATRARVLRAALDCYASAQVAVPSIRAVARAAGVSAGSVQHFFPSQSALRGALDDYVVDLVVDEFGMTLTGDSAAAVGAKLDQRLTHFLADHPVECRYLARTLVDGGQTARELFAALVRLSTAQWCRLADDGLTRPDVDLEWAALHVVIVNIATALLSPLIEDHLGTPLSEPPALRRWQRAQTALFDSHYAPDEE